MFDLKMAMAIMAIRAIFGHFGHYGHGDSENSFGISMHYGERIIEGPMVFLRGGHFCLNLMIYASSLITVA